MKQPSAPARHDLVRLHADGWAASLGRRADLVALPMLAGWVGQGRPFVARRRGPCDPEGTIALGLPLPPSLGKRRLGFAAPIAAVASIAPPPLLAGLAAPAAWRPTIRRLLALGRRCGVQPRAFGSFAWQALTGLDYIGEASDLDLLWPLSAATPALLAALPPIAAAAPGGIDGEINDPRGGGVQWRELAGAAGGDGTVLRKAIDGVALVEAAAFLRGEGR